MNNGVGLGPFGCRFSGCGSGSRGKSISTEQPKCIGGPEPARPRTDSSIYSAVASIVRSFHCKTGKKVPKKQSTEADSEAALQEGKDYDRSFGRNMTDPYRRYAAAPERQNVPMPSFPGYVSSDSAGLASNHLWTSSDLRGASVDYLRSDVVPLRSGSYGLNDVAGISSRAAPGLPGLTAGTGAKGFPTPSEDSTLIAQRRDPALGITPGIPSGISDILPERSNFSRNTEGLLADDSNILFVDGLPNDCSRREVAHLFRPFIGFKEIRVIHREPRKSGDKALVLCFVEFNDPKCARTALQALQGYKFDDKKPDAPALRIQFARFPFHPSAALDDGGRGSVH